MSSSYIPINEDHDSLLLPQNHDMFYRQSEPTKPMSRKRRMRILLSYLPDWYVTSLHSGLSSTNSWTLGRSPLRSRTSSETLYRKTRILIFYCRVIFFSLDLVQGYRRDFSLTDTSYVIRRVLIYINVHTHYRLVGFSIRKSPSELTLWLYLTIYSYAIHERIPVRNSLRARSVV